MNATKLLIPLRQSSSGQALTTIISGGLDFEHVEDQLDQRAWKLRVIDPNLIRLENALYEGEIFIPGSERIRRLRATGFILLHPGIMLELLAEEKRERILPESWSQDVKNPRFGYEQPLEIFFDGMQMHLREARATATFTFLLTKYPVEIPGHPDKWRWDYRYHPLHEEQGEAGTSIHRVSAVIMEADYDRLMSV